MSVEVLLPTERLPTCDENERFLLEGGDVESMFQGFSIKKACQIFLPGPSLIQRPQYQHRMWCYGWRTWEKGAVVD